MKKLLYMTTLSIVVTLLLAPAALAQESSDIDCSVPAETTGTPEGFFSTIPGANACFVAEALPDLISVLNSTAYDADTGEEIGLVKDVDPNLAANNSYEDFCAAFPSLVDDFTAQEYFETQANAQEQAILDPDGNGIACDAAEPGAGGDQYQDEPPVAPEGEMQPPVTPQAEPDVPDTTTALPDTGGASLLLPAAGLLLASGLIGLTIVRRRS